MARIAMVNAPFYSHAGAMSRLAAVLVRQHHEVTVWAPEARRGEVEACGAQLEPHVVKLPRASDLELAAELAAATERIAEELIAQLHSRKIDLIVRDNQAIWALVAGEFLGLPTVVSHPMFPLPDPKALAAKTKGAVRAPKEAEADQQRARARFDAIWMSIAGRWGVEIADINGVFHRTSEPTIAYTTKEIVGPTGLAAGWHCVGPLLEPGPEVKRPAGRPLVYVCFGTSYNFRFELFRVVIEALGGLAMDVLVSTGGGRVGPADLGSLPDNVEVREFVPAREVLARASLHITHGGCNSVHESLRAAVPMVCIPQAYDQFPLTVRVEEMGVGVTVEETAGEIRAAVRSMLASVEAQQRARLLSEHLRTYDGEARVAAVIDAAAAEAAAVG